MKRLEELTIHHTGYVVKDLDAVVRHLADTYGFAADEPYFFRPDRAWAEGKEVSEYCLKICMLHTAEGGILEFIQPISGTGIHQQFLDEGNSGIQHVCFSVKDYDSWHAFFEERPARIVFEAEVEDDRFGYRRCFYAEDRTSGVMIEIKEEPYFRNGMKGLK